MKKWLQLSGVERGYVATAQAIYDMSGDWYEGRMDESWDPPTPEAAEAAEAIFKAHGLVGEFWSLT